MTHVLTLVAADHCLIDLAQPVTAALRAEGALLERLEWLRSGSVCDLFFVGPTSAQVDLAVRRVIGAAPVDLAVQAVVGRRKRILLADMESTVIKNEMLEELADFVGLRSEVEEITRRAMNGEIDFRAALEERVALLRGLDAAVLEECLELIRFDPGARALVATLRHHDVFTALVSGGFTFFADWVGARAGFDVVHANRLEIENGKLTGRVLEPILDKSTKLRLLEESCQERHLEAAAAVTVGDGANDLPMLQAAGLGVAFHGKKSVAAAAPFRIDFGDLRTLLYFQGYHDREIVSA
jgi:phosphoserine phosphatase